MVLEALGTLPVRSHSWSVFLAPKNWRVPVSAGTVPSQQMGSSTGSQETIDEHQMCLLRS